MTAEKRSDHANQPDHPADRCRAILRALLPVTDFARQELPGQFAELVMTLSRGQRDRALPHGTSSACGLS